MKGKKVFVHCFAGRDRTEIMVSAYNIAKNRYTWANVWLAKHAQELGKHYEKTLQELVANARLAGKKARGKAPRIKPPPLHQKPK